jgi:uncharacterized protein (TIGR03435 family)
MVVRFSGRLWLRRAMSLALAVVGTSVAPLFGRQQPAQRPAFEAATIKLAASAASPLPVAPAAPNRLRIPSKTLTLLIYEAYGNGGYNTGTRVTGGPDWVSKTAFFIEGVAAGPATRQRMRLMLQTLLEERFALKISNETTTGDMLTLVVDRADGVLGPKVRKWDGTCPAVIPPLVFPAARRPLQRVGDKFVVPPASDTDAPEEAYCPTGYRVGGIIADGVKMTTVASLLSLPPARELLGNFTEDHTGLTGRYTLDLDYVFPPQPDAPSLFTVLKEQWGLRVVPGKGTFRTIRVESAQLPTMD